MSAPGFFWSVSRPAKITNARSSAPATAMGGAASISSSGTPLGIMNRGVGNGRMSRQNASPTSELAMTALARIQDPDLRKDIVELGFVDQGTMDLALAKAEDQGTLAERIRAGGYGLGGFDPELGFLVPEGGRVFDILPELLDQLVLLGGLGIAVVLGLRQCGIGLLLRPHHVIYLGIMKHHPRCCLGQLHREKKGYAYHKCNMTGNERRSFHVYTYLFPLEAGVVAVSRAVCSTVASVLRVPPRHGCKVLVLPEPPRPNHLLPCLGMRLGPIGDTLKMQYLTQYNAIAT